MPRGTVDVAVDIDVFWSVLGSIQYNGAVNWVPGGVFRTVGLLSEGA